jgi:hypothetical protein
MQPRISPTVSTILASFAMTSLAQAQVPLTVINGFNLFTWNAGTEYPGDSVWSPEKPSTGFPAGLRWVWSERDGMDNVVAPDLYRVYDPAVPGITGAYKFPEARATTLNEDGSPRPSFSWEDQAQPGESGTFEIWFKPDDLTGSHVLWEIGATNKGVAFALEDDELVYAVEANDGAGGNVASIQHRQQLTDTGWHQAIIVIDLVSFQVKSYLDGNLVNQQAFTPSPTYRWTGGNPAGLGTLGVDADFPDAGIAGDAVPTANLTDFNGMIAIHRFYDLDLFDNEIMDNYDAITDAAAADRRADYNGDGSVDANDALDFLSFAAAADTTPISPFQYPFPHNGAGGVQTNDPAMDETFVGDFAWDLDAGFNGGGQEPTFQFPVVNILEPVPVNDTAIPSVRQAFLLNGAEGFRGPKFEFADDTTSAHVLFWLHVDDLVGNHCLFEAGGNAVGFSMYTIGDEILGHINTSVNDGLDEVTVSSGPGVLQTGWHRFEIIVRRFAGGGVGQGYELYMDGQQIAAINDLPGPDGEFGTADDIDNFSPAGTGNSNFIGGNQASFADDVNSIAIPASLSQDDLTPFNGLVGPFRLIQNQPLPADVAANFAADASQNVVNDRADLNGDGSADFFDVLRQLEIIDAAQ